VFVDEPRSQLLGPFRGQLTSELWLIRLFQQTAICCTLSDGARHFHVLGADALAQGGVRHDDLSTADAVARRDTVFCDPLVADRSDIKSAGAGLRRDVPPIVTYPKL